jgi:hypothetical protein
MIKRKGRLIPKWLSWPIGADRQYETAAQFYKRWFVRGENRFKANGLHGHSGNYLFAAFDKGNYELPQEEYMAALRQDYALHTRRRFAGRKLRSKQTLHKLGLKYV